jgi:mandelate racemase
MAEVAVTRERKAASSGTADALTIRGVRTRAVEVPMTYVLGTSAGAIRSAPLLLVDLETEEGITGRSYVFCFYTGGARPMANVLADAAELVKGARVAPADIAALMARQFLLIGVTGVVRMALSALDAALWDALAIAAGRPLAALLGSAPRRIPAYNSNGLGLMGPQATAEEALKMVAEGFKAVKLRLGYKTLQEDVAVTRAVRRALPDDVTLMTDYNQALDLPEALRRGRALQDEGIHWIEEPIRHDDYAGNAALARELSVAIQIGENFNGPQAMAEALTADACDLVMPDLARIGGVTGWMQAAGLAAARGIPMSSHLFSETSAHLLAATPTCHWLEYMDWANALVEEPLEIEDGCAVVPDRPGCGLVWDEAAVTKYQIA